MYRVRFQKSALKVFRRLPPSVQQRFDDELDRIAADPSAYRGDWKPLKGSPFWRLRVGAWRAVCELRGNELVLLVLKLGPRGDVYK